MTIERWLPDLFDGSTPSLRALAGPIDAGLPDLSDAERALVERAVPTRQAEFATGRRMARRLLDDLGFPLRSLLRDEDRVPLWPTGTVGSISHARDLCVVAAAHASEVAAIGVDVEPDAPLEVGIWSRIATPEELGFIAEHPEPERGVVAHAIFSVKECVYKAAFPMRRERWGFQDVTVRLVPEQERFFAETPSSGATGREQVAGRLLRRDGFFIAGVLHPR